MAPAPMQTCSRGLFKKPPRASTSVFDALRPALGMTFISILTCQYTRQWLTLGFKKPHKSILDIYGGIIDARKQEDKTCSH
jgi:hypothetical protein